MNPLPLVSVIIPVYNVKPYLRRCLDSILNQTYTNMEIIIVDDGSTDGSGKICDEYKDRDSRITVIHKQNGGLSSARNAGLDMARGDLVSFVDSDDWLDNDTYLPLVESYRKTGADITVFGYYEVTGNKKEKMENSEFMESDKILSSTEAVNLLIENKKIRDFVWNKVFVRILFDRYRFSAGKTFEDILIMFSLFLAVKEIAVLGSHYKYFHFRRNGSIMNTNNYQTSINYFDAIYTRYQILKNNNIVNPETLFFSAFNPFMGLIREFPLQARKTSGRYRAFLDENTAWIKSAPLYKSYMFFLRLPFPVFVLLVNPLFRHAYCILGNAVGKMKLPTTMGGV